MILYKDEKDTQAEKDDEKTDRQEEEEEEEEEEAEASTRNYVFSIYLSRRCMQRTVQLNDGENIHF